MAPDEFLDGVFAVADEYGELLARDREDAYGSVVDGRAGEFSVEEDAELGGARVVALCMDVPRVVLEVADRFCLILDNADADAPFAGVGFEDDRPASDMCGGESEGGVE